MSGFELDFVTDSNFKELSEYFGLHLSSEPSNKLVYSDEENEDSYVEGKANLIAKKYPKIKLPNNPEKLSIDDIIKIYVIARKISIKYSNRCGNCNRGIINSTCMCVENIKNYLLSRVIGKWSEKNKTLM